MNLSKVYSKAILILGVCVRRLLGHETGILELLGPHC